MGKIAVIGAGPAGCVAAYQLRQQGNDVTLFEAEPYIGGRTYSFRDQGYHVDTGAGFFTNFYPTLLQLLSSLSIPYEKIALNRTTALIDKGKIGHLTLGSIRSYSQYPFLTWKDKFKMGAHTAQLTATRSRYSLTEIDKLEQHDDQSTADYVRQQLSETIYNYIVRPGIEPFWYFSCEEISRSLYMALTCQAIDAKFYTLRSGMDTLCQTMAKSVEVKLNTSIKQITAKPNGNLPGPQLQLACQQTQFSGEIEQVTFDSVVIATTASVAHTITTGLEHQLVSEFQRDFLRSQRYVPNIHAIYLAEQFERQYGSASLFPCGPGEHKVAAVAFNSAKSEALRNDNKELIGIYLGREPSKTLLQASKTEIDNTIYQYAREMYSELPEEVTPFVHKVRPEAIPIPEVGRYRKAAQFQAQQSGPVVFAGDYLSTATVEGALVTGNAAVKALTSQAELGLTPAA